MVSEIGTIEIEMVIFWLKIYYVKLLVKIKGNKMLKFKIKIY